MMLTLPEKIVWIVMLAFCAYSITTMLNGAEIKCEVVQVVEAWDEKLERYMPVTFYDCGSYSYTEPEGVEYQVIDGRIVWMIPKGGSRHE